MICANTTIRSYLDTIGTGLRDSQIIYLREGSAYSRSDAKGSQGPKRLGMEYWEAKTETHRCEGFQGKRLVEWPSTFPMYFKLRYNSTRWNEEGFFPYEILSPLEPTI